MPSSRVTAQRQKIREAIAGESAFLSAQALHEKLSRKGEKIGLATVYRTLGAMAETGEIDSIRQGNEVLYRACATHSHHHHIVCRQCGRTVEISEEIVEKWAHQVAAQAGFSDISHTIEILGLCPQCAH